ncbi:protein SPT2 homolog [Aquila chrysaetos chrysaetos]|uniref:protein SPT2 homolog n=1 Tax=Aquila chrysaetos chrysaetos TaxID=223781 RepID=UPI001176DA05|nr:protein SPT2 homolog [Aquila chrysaetos chrysaetos]
MHPDSKHIVHDLRLQARGGLCTVVRLGTISSSVWHSSKYNKPFTPCVPLCEELRGGIGFAGVGVGFFGGDGGDPQGKNNKLRALTSGREEKGFASLGRAKTRRVEQREAVASRGGPGWAERGFPPARRGGDTGRLPRLPRARGRVCRTWAVSLGEGGGRERGRKPPARRGAGNRGAGGGRRQLRSFAGRSDTAGGLGEGNGTAEGSPRGRARHGLGGPVRREAARGPPAGWLGTRSSSSSPLPPPPAAIQRATAAVSTGYPRSRLSLAGACLRARPRPPHPPRPGRGPLAVRARERRRRGPLRGEPASRSDTGRGTSRR